jgi:DnaJ-domain-containing protein 1
MGIWSRLGNVIESYINDLESEFKSTDPDLDAAYEELDDYLNRKEAPGKAPPRSNENLPPQELRADFELLGAPFNSDLETCKAAYKKLLKIHHPDRHAGHEGNYKKATERSARLNAAWKRIEEWFTK